VLSATNVVLTDAPLRFRGGIFPMRIRKRLFVDHKVQGALMLRAVEYWFFCLSTIGLGLLGWSLLTGPDQPLYMFFLDAWHFFLPTAIVSLLILPLLVYDILRLSNKFAGPLYRLRRELRRLAAGEKVPPIKFRVGDYWPELADEFNAASQRMEMLAALAENERKSAEPTKQARVQDHLQLPQSATGKRSAASAAPVTPIAAAMLEDTPLPGSLPDALYDVPRSKW
jgi:hypothetical protein